ncbi:Spy0128 family protein [Streptococcus suis]|uniref:Spy0128 family protein n=1 Tax=Streptococcus suis TaxID=1307 RepID=UPI0014792DD3
MGNSSISDEHVFFVALHFTTRVSDSLQNTAVKILPETFKIEFVDWYYDGSNWQYRNAKNVTANYTVTFTDTSFSVNLGDIPATQGVRIRYDVKADYVPSSGEVFINKVNLKSKENPGREVEEKTTYRSAGGQAEGYVYGIQIKKVDEKGAPLANAHFDIIREANGEVVDQFTTDENGYATIGQLLRGDYILRETQAPDGYELLDTDVRVSGTEFSQSNQTVVKEIVNKLKPEEPTPTPFSIPVKLRAEKVLEGKELAGNDFSFELLQDGQVLDTKQNDASGKVTFDELVFTEEGTFVYKLREVNDSQENIVYDETVVTATVTVTRIKDGALAKIEYSTGAVGEKRVLSATATIVGGAGGLTSGVGHSSEIPAAASFVNQYVEPTPASIVLEAHKTFEGRTLNGDDFSFELVNAETNEVIETAVNDANGKISFSAIEYASAGEHKYIIREVAGTDINIVYDSKSYTVNVKVTAENDKYVAEVTYETANGLAPTFVNSVKPTPTSINLEARKKLEGRTLNDGEFSFELVNAETNEVIETAVNDANGKISFSAIEYASAGEHKYIIREVAGTDINIVYDSKSYTVNVKVTAENDKYVAEVTYETANGLAPTFVNSVKPTPTSINLEARKKLEGRTLNDGEFSFELVNAETNEVIETAVNDADGKISFSAIEYASAGEHNYIIREVKGSDANIDYDSKSYTVNVKVTAENDTYVAEVTYEDGSAPTFVNTVKPDPDPDPDPDPTPDPEPTPETPTYSGTMKKQVLPNTGQANHSLISIIGLVLLILVGITSRLLAGYKK